MDFSKKILDFIHKKRLSKCLILNESSGFVYDCEVKPQNDSFSFVYDDKEICCLDLDRCEIKNNELTLMGDDYVLYILRFY